MAIVTISIVSHGHGALVAHLLRDLSRQTLADDLHVVLTLNLPEPEPPASCAGLRVTVLRNDRPKGFGANHNAALRATDTPWVIVLNPDIRLDDATLIGSLIRNHSGDDVGLVAPLIVNSREEREDSIRRNLDPLSLFARAALRRGTIVDPAGDPDRFFWVAGMFMALPSRVWRAVGGFDERFFLYCEDYDLCARLNLRGYEVRVDPSLRAIHYAQRSSRTSLKYLRWHVASLVRVWLSPHFWRIWASDLRLRGPR